MTRGIHRINWAGRTIPYAVTRTDRSTLGISVHADGSVAVRAPQGLSDEKIAEQALRFGHWIAANIDRVERWRPRRSERLYVSGETHLYLGRHYRLAFQPSSDEGVSLQHGRIVIRSKRGVDANNETKRLLQQWYRTRAGIVLRQRLDANFPRFQEMGLSKPQLSIRSLKKRWGSTTTKGNLILNRDLVQAPGRCIDYVIVHELCHLKYHGHGAKFWKLLERVMPDFAARKDALERLMA